MAVRAYSPILPSVEVFGAYEGIASATGVNQKVSLTFTPTTGNLTIVPYDGDDNISQLQLEVGSTPSSYIPTTVSSTVTRAADTLTVPSANLPWPTEAPLAVSIQMEGTSTWAGGRNANPNTVLLDWRLNSSNYINIQWDSNASLKIWQFLQVSSGVVDLAGVNVVNFGGINEPFNIASRHGSTFINGAVDGTALTANTTPIALPDLSSADMQIGDTFMGTIKLFRVWSDDLTDAGIEKASA